MSTNNHVSETIYVPDWQDRVGYGTDGPNPTILFENEQLKVIIGALKPGQEIPSHPEKLATYHFLAGEGVMIVDGDQTPVKKGTTIVVQDGSRRGITAGTHLVFLANRIG